MHTLIWYLGKDTKLNPSSSAAVMARWPCKICEKKGGIFWFSKYFIPKFFCEYFHI